VAAGRSQLNINCSPELLARVKARARLEGVSVTELVVRLLQQMVEEGEDCSLGERLEAIEKRLFLLETAVLQ
jgi:hypothetical protein